MDFLDRANGASLHQQHRHAVEARGVNLDAHLRDDALEAGQLSQLSRFVEVMSQRLLAIDILAQLQRGHGDGRMHVVGGGDVYRVEMYPRKTLLHLHGAPEVHVSHSDQVNPLELGQLVKVLPGHTGGAETGVTQHAVGRPGQQVTRDEGRSQTCAAEDFEE